MKLRAQIVRNAATNDVVNLSDLICNMNFVFKKLDEILTRRRSS